MNRWYIFLSVILCTYSAMHLYLLIKVRRAYYLESWAYFLIVVILLFFLLAPFQARVLASQNNHLMAMAMAWIGFIWMGGLFIWIWLSLVMDAYHLVVMTLQRLFCTDWIHLLLSRRQSLFLTFLATFALMIYGAYAAQHIRVAHKTFASGKLPAEAGTIRLVQISDLHLGQINLPGRLDRVIDQINAADADIVVSTGDLIDGHIYNRKAIIQKLKTIKAKLGKFAVTGNHEVYAGLAYAAEVTQEAGFEMLSGQTRPIGQTITLAGVDDPAVPALNKNSEAQLLASVPANRFTILLKHQPRTNPDAIGRFDLQLSGHTHEGQIFPFTYVVRWAYPFFSGMYPIQKGGKLYVSRGTGTWGPPIRLGAPAEITIFDIVPPKTAPTQTQPSK